MSRAATRQAKPALCGEKGPFLLPAPQIASARDVEEVAVQLEPAVIGMNVRAAR